MPTKTASFMLFFCLVSMLITFSQQLNNGNNIGDGSVDANTIVSDLQSGNRGIFAVGYVSGKLTLLVSGPGDHKNPTGGFQVTVEEATDGVFQIASIPVPVSSGIPGDADVKFVGKDSTGANLVAVSSSEVGVVLLPSGHYEKTEVGGSQFGCYLYGGLHLSSSEDVHFYAAPNGIFRKYQFDNDQSIKTSKACSYDGSELGQLCINDDRIFLEAKCGASVPTGIISGFVGPKNAYLFDGSNTVYAFDSSVFTSKQHVKLTKRPKEQAFVGSVMPNTATVVPEGTSTESTALMLIIGVICLLVLILAPALIVIFCCCNKSSGKKCDSSNAKAACKGFRSGGKGGGGGSSRNSRRKQSGGSANRSSGKSKSKGFSSSRSKPQ